MRTQATATLLVAILSLTAFAQSGPGPKSLLAQARDRAVAEIAQLKTQLQAEYDKDDYKPCLARELEIRKEYNEWFVAHYAQFQEIETRISSAVDRANLKLASLETATIETIPLEGQAGKTRVSFQSLVKYFQRYNKRIKVCSKDERKQLDEDMKHPERTGLGVGHEQVTAAMQNMTVNLNASLREADSEYELFFSPAECGYKLELRVKIAVAGEKKVYDFSLLEREPVTSAPRLEIPETSKWAAWVEARHFIDGEPVDGLARYRLLQEKRKGACESLPAVPGVRSDLPYVAYGDIATYAKNAKKQGIDPYLNLDVAVYTDDGCGKKIGAVSPQMACDKLVLPYLNANVWSVSIGGTCLNIDDRTFPELCRDLTRIAAEPIIRKPVVQLYADDACHRDLLGLDPKVDYSVLEPITKIANVWSLRVENRCVNIDDVPFTAVRAREWIEAAQNMRKGDDRVAPVELFSDDGCKNPVNELRRGDDCSLLSRFYGNANVWSVRLPGGECENIDDLGFSAACQQYTR